MSDRLSQPVVVFPGVARMAIHNPEVAIVAVWGIHVRTNNLELTYEIVAHAVLASINFETSNYVPWQL